MKILRSLPMTKYGTQFKVVKTDRYTKLKEVVQTARRTFTVVKTIFVDRWIPNLRIKTTVITDSGLQFISKFF